MHHYDDGESYSSTLRHHYQMQIAQNKRKTQENLVLRAKANLVFCQSTRNVGKSEIKWWKFPPKRDIIAASVGVGERQNEREKGEMKSLHNWIDVQWQRQRARAEAEATYKV